MDWDAGEGNTVVLNVGFEYDYEGFLVHFIASAPLPESV